MPNALVPRPKIILYTSEGHVRLNMTHMSRYVQVHPAYIWRICHGRVEPSLSVAKLMAEYLNVSLGGLYELLGHGNDSTIKLVSEKVYQKELRQQALDNPELHAKIDL